MTEYQATIIRLSGKVLEDEESITDELNDRRRSGWVLCQLVPLSTRRLVAVFECEG